MATRHYNVMHNATQSGIKEKSMKVRNLSLCLIIAAGLSYQSFAQTLPPEIQADRHMISAKKAIDAGDHLTAIDKFEQIILLDVTVPTEFWFFYADSLHRAGKNMESKEAIISYLNEAGQSGENYQSALELLDQVENALDWDRGAPARDAEAAKLRKLAIKQSMLKTQAIEQERTAAKNSFNKLKSKLENYGNRYVSYEQSVEKLNLDDCKFRYSRDYNGQQRRSSSFTVIKNNYPRSDSGTVYFSSLADYDLDSDEYVIVSQGEEGFFGGRETAYAESKIYSLGSLFVNRRDVDDIRALSEEILNSCKIISGEIEPETTCYQPESYKCVASGPTVTNATGDLYKSITNNCSGPIFLKGCLFTNNGIGVCDEAYKKNGESLSIKIKEKAFSGKMTADFAGSYTEEKSRTCFAESKYNRSAIWKPKPKIVRTVTPQTKATDKDAQPLVRLPPIFPQLFLQGDYSGYCKVRFDVGTTGEILNPKTTLCTDEVLVDATLTSVRAWRYSPQISNSIPVLRTGIETTVRFDLTAEDGSRLPLPTGY